MKRFLKIRFSSILHPAQKFLPLLNLWHTNSNAFVFLFYFLFFTFHLKAQWVQQTLPVNKPITGIEFVDTLRGWACTSYGTAQDSAYIIYTTNSGTNWLVQLSAYNLSFTDIDMLNSLTGYASGFDLNINRDKLFQTTNGGVNWTFITMVPNMGIGDMQFINKDSAWESGGIVGPDVRTTTDGGNTWFVRTIGITGATGRIFFLNYNTGFCAAQFNLYKTTNAGMNWSPNGSFAQQIQSVFFISETMGWLGFSNNNRIRYTSNGGLNWIDQTTPPVQSTPIYDLFFFNNLTGYAGYGVDKIFKTRNGGTNWGYQLDTGGALKMTFTDTLNGWTANFLGITRTLNGGGPIIYTGFVNNGNSIPEKFKLYQNYPNPFNPATNIKLDLPKASNINLIICDILGREIYTITNEYLKPGTYSFTWDARNYSSGVYFYRIAIHSDRLTTDKYTETKKMILAK